MKIQLAVKTDTMDSLSANSFDKVCDIGTSRGLSMPLEIFAKKIFNWLNCAAFVAWMGLSALFIGGMDLLGQTLNRTQQYGAIFVALLVVLAIRPIIKRIQGRQIFVLAIRSIIKRIRSRQI